jgi:hypothetical protein
VLDRFFLSVGVLFLAMGILAVIIAMMRLVHAFMQHLRAFPGMLVAGGRAKNETGNGQSGGEDFHDGRV